MTVFNQRRRPPRAVAPVLSVLLIVLSALAVQLTLPSPAGAAGRAGTVGHYAPPPGASFNNPIGTPWQQRKLVQQVIRTTDSAPAGSVIRMAVFSFGDPETADALLAAYHRGVQVRLVFSGSNDYPAMQRLRAAIGDDPTKPSFVVSCERSCRGERGEMHAKYFSFSKAGPAKWITMVGSVNLTRYNAEEQWNDLYTRVDDRAYFGGYLRWFGQLKRDQPVADPFMQQTVGDTTIEMTPVDPGAYADPVLEDLRKVRCEVPMGEIDPGSTTPDQVVHTAIDISAHAWNEDRGKAIARRFVALKEAGCRIKVFYGVGMGAAVKSILQNNGIPMRKGHHPGVRTHEKVMVVDGGFDGDPSTVRAWTGSHNWSNRALTRDDLIVRIDDQQVAGAYLQRFLWMWDHA